MKLAGEAFFGQRKGLIAVRLKLMTCPPQGVDLPKNKWPVFNFLDNMLDGGRMGSFYLGPEKLPQAKVTLLKEIMSGWKYLARRLMSILTSGVSF